MCCKRHDDHRSRSLNEQISRHYIHNSLQIIAGLCDTEPEKAKEAIISFSDYLRINMDKEMLKDLVGFDRELENTKIYIELEHLSGSRPFEVEFRIGPRDFMLPPLTLQPVVENAIRYGTGRNGDVNKIEISTAETAGGVMIEVLNAVPLENLTFCREPGGNGIAFQNISTRLDLLCRGTLKFEIADGIAKTTIKIPKNKRRSR